MGDLGVKPTRLLYVLLYSVDPVDVIPLSPVEKDIASARAATGVQPSGPGGDQLLEPVHQVRTAAEPRMGDVAIYGLKKAVAYFCVTLCVTLVEGLGQIWSLAHC